MKKFLYLSLILLLYINASAKKVKFAVDMTGQAINVNGIHLSGDMQDEAGYPADWEPNTIRLAQEGTSRMYSVVLDIPAHRKYEYKFVNGDLFYEVEFVPEESRVGYDFNDNRWIYIDSLANDTFVVGPLLFAGNAPAGKKLVHFKVDLKSAGTVDANGIHLASSLNNWNYENIKLYRFINQVYEYHGYVDSNTVVEYKFVNGNTQAKAETVPAACANNGNRTLTVNIDQVLDSVCFASCGTCTESSTGMAGINMSMDARIYPNPAGDVITVSLQNDEKISSIVISDLSGKNILHEDNANTGSISMNTSALHTGLYFITISAGAKTGVSKLIISK